MSLINAKMEGEYWDFKEMHHENKACLLHDIICMANNRADRDAYIIFGVRDKDFKVVGIENDKNRRNQQQFLDFLKDKKFIGGVRPIIKLRTIKLCGKELDILIIENKYDTPYYLVEDFRDREKVVKAQYIYTRVGDSNTDINKGADINQVEYLWRKRFLLNRPPLEQIKKKLLNKLEWKREGDIYYNIFNPEYTIEIEENERLLSKLEFYSYAMENETTTYGNLSIKSYGTKLFSCQVVSLDSARYFTTVPEWEYISFDKYKKESKYCFKFFIKDTINYILHDFFYDESNSEEEYANSNFCDIVLFFKNEDEKNSFIKNIYTKEEIFKKLVEENKERYKFIECYDKLKDENIKRLSTGFTLNLMLNEFRNSINK